MTSWITQNPGAQPAGDCDLFTDVHELLAKAPHLEDVAPRKCGVLCRQKADQASLHRTPHFLSQPRDFYVTSFITEDQMR